MSNERRYYDFLKLIAKSDSLAWIEKNSEKAYALSPREARTSTTTRKDVGMRAAAPLPLFCGPRWRSEQAER